MMKKSTCFGNPEEGPRKRDHRLAWLDGPSGLYVILGLSCLLKLALLIVTVDKTPNADGIRYLRAAQELASGNLEGSLRIYPMPVLPALMAGVHLLVPDWALSGRILSSVFMVLAQIPLYKITQGWFGCRAAFFACLAFALQPFGNEMSTLIYRGPGHLLFFAWALRAMLRALEHPSAPRLAAAFLLSLLPAAFRIEGALLVPFFPLSVMGLALKDKRFRGRPVLLAAAWMLVPAAALLLVWHVSPQSLWINRVDDIKKMVVKIWHLKFLDQYKVIYEHLRDMESLGPLPTQDQNFGEIARHFLWLIYLIGLIQTVARTLYPVFLIPLAVGLRSARKNLYQGYTLSLWLAYFLLLYIQLIQKDCTGERFVWTCAFLLYPWVGHGISSILAWNPSANLRRLLKGALLLLLVALPLSKLPKTVEKPDLVAAKAGQWLRQSPCRNLRILGNDYRIPLSAGIPFDYKNRKDALYWHFDPEDKDYSTVERLAQRTKRDLILLKLPNKKSTKPPPMSHYRLITTLKDERRVVFVFGTPEAALLCSSGSEPGR